MLRAPCPLARLLDALSDVDRLVLLGDTVELLEARPDEALSAAAPVLAAIGDAVGPAGEVIVVPGNHDRLLIRNWLREPGRRLAVDAEVPPDCNTLLAQVVAALHPAHVTVRYPGVWLAERTWATHGHYLDRHLLPEAAYGIARGALGRLPSPDARPEEYEQQVSLTALEGPMTRWLPARLAARVDDLVAAARRRSLGTPPRRPLPESAFLARLRTRVLGTQMRRAAIPAIGHVAHRLGVVPQADAVIFGHVHRAGPRPGDDPAQWTGPGGTPRIYNSGCWVHEPLLLHRAEAPHAYWPGGYIQIEQDEIIVGELLGAVAAAQLTPV